MQDKILTRSGGEWEKVFFELVDRDKLRYVASVDSVLAVEVESLGPWRMTLSLPGSMLRIAVIS